MINNESIELLFKTMEFYDDQYGKIADMCFADVEQALTEIVQAYLPVETEVLPYGSYRIKSNYQVCEPMEFYVVLHGDKDQIEKAEAQQKMQEKKQGKRGHNYTIKNVYQNILSGSSNLKQVVTAFDAAKTIMEKMQQYISAEDLVYFKNNVVFVKFHSTDDVQILATITIVYDFDDNGLYTFKKYGISTNENSRLIIDNIQLKNKQTNGNYIVLCKLVKMLELELIITNLSTKYLSKKSLFVESILYNIPNEFYNTDNFCEMLSNATNYLKNLSYEDIVLPDNLTKMFPQHGYYAKDEFKSFVKKITHINQHTNQMLQETIKQSKQQSMQQQNQTSNQNDKNNKITKKLGKH